MKVFVTGVGGQLGHDVMNELAKCGYDGVGSDIASTYSGVQDDSSVTSAPYVQLDITDAEAVKIVLSEVKPDVVIHCAAWTAVDMAEDDDKVEKVRAINAGGTQNIATVCKALDCKLVYISTDYVFDGQGTEPWQPDCKDYKPLNVYGQTKLEGELAVDLRKGSEIYGKCHGKILTAENAKQFYISKGFAHGFLVLSDIAEFCYRCTDFYHPGDEGGSAWNAPEINIKWPNLVGEYQGCASAEGYMFEDGKPLNLSDKDQKWLGLKDTFQF